LVFETPPLSPPMDAAGWFSEEFRPQPGIASIAASAQAERSIFLYRTSIISKIG
jgi:hypothetical protein